MRLTIIFQLSVLTPKIQTHILRLVLLQEIFIRVHFHLKKILPVDIYCAICELKENCGAGLDGLEAKYIKLAAHILMYPLADLFNLSLTTC